MKKLCILMMFMAIASISFASANFEFKVIVNDQPINVDHVVAPSDIVTISLVDNDSMSAPSYNLWGVTAGEYVSGYLNPVIMGGIMEQPPAGYAFSVFANGMTSPGNQPGIVYSFDFHIPDNSVWGDIIYIEPLEGAYGGVVLTTLPPILLGVNVAIPEPMTVTLLGLGGLLIRRRK